MTNDNQDLPLPPGVVDSMLPTPILSPSGSAEPSPAFVTILQTPDGSDVEDFDFELGEPAEARTAAKDAGIPECWGHRGVSRVRPCSAFADLTGLGRLP